MTHDFTDDVAIVTGGTKGIGRAVTDQLVRDGATVVAFYYSDEDAAERTQTELEDASGTVDTRAVDVRETAAVSDAVDAISDAYGDPTLLVNNAGVMRNTFLLRMDEQQWDTVVDTNLKGAYNCLQAVARPMMFGDAGAVVNVSSVAGVRGWGGQANYAASKSGLIGLTRSSAREFGRRNVRVNAVVPGYVRTDLLEETAEAMDEELDNERERIPLDRFADPSEVADTITYLLSEDASYVHGSVLRVDGGLLA